MVTQAQMAALGRFNQHDAHQYAVELGWPDGIRVYPLTRDGDTWISRTGFYFTVDPEGVIRTPKGARPAWDRQGVR